MSDFDELGGPPPLTDFDFNPESILPSEVDSIRRARRLWWEQGSTPEALLAVARAYAESRGVLIPSEAGWEQAAFLLGAIAQDIEAADAALRLWRTSPGASGRLASEPNGDRRISVTDAAEAAGVNRSYIKAEIRRGNLPAARNATRNWEIRLADFREWMSNPKRGSRSR